MDRISLAVDRLRAGAPVAFPTETVFGLGADATNPSAILALFTLKRRPASIPIAVLVTGPDMARALVADWPPLADRLASAFWPGPLTITLPRSPSVPNLLTASGPTLGLRAPDHPLALQLISRFGRAIAATSANLSGHPPALSSAQVRREFADHPDLLILDDVSPSPSGIASTVISISTAGQVQLLRPGALLVDEIESVIGCRITGATQ